MINARFKKFRTQYELLNMQDGFAFERFVNYNIFSSLKPGVFSGDDELFELVCVGDEKDMGIDGLAVIVNGFFVRSVSDVIDIASRSNKITAEFVFIQSKYKPNFDKNELNNFIDGVRDFLSDSHKFPRNEKIDKLLEIKDFILREDDHGEMMWEENPSVRLYYVAMGVWRGSEHQEALINQFKEDIERLNTYNRNINFIYVDSDVLKKYCDNNENAFSETINTISSMPLTEVDNVDNSCIALCYANELVKLLTMDENQTIRKSLFYDNVRDYLGDNNINDEIRRTIEYEPEKFILLNNGLTIVCDSYQQSNRKITIKNPQIVNGCQTSHVIFYADRAGLDVGQVPINIKIIATDKSDESDITNQIVRGTNRQNIVYDETFEVTREFHKKFEDYVNSISEDYVRLYYERRTKQYLSNPMIKQSQKVTLRILIQSFIAMFMNAPDVAYRHQSKLLKDYQNKIFIYDNNFHQSFLPYFVAALANYRLENLFKEMKISKKDYYSFKHHLLMLFREIVAGPTPDINDMRQIEQYSSILLDALKSEYQTENNFKKAIQVFDETRKIWVINMKRSSSGIKDISDFTKLLLKEVRGKYKHTTTFGGDENTTYRGIVVTVGEDRYGQYFGYIKREPQNIFFHSRLNPYLDFPNLKRKVVSYKITPNIKKPGNYFAVDVKVINS